MSLLSQHLPSLVQEIQPDLIFYQAGAVTVGEKNTRNCKVVSVLVDICIMIYYSWQCNNNPCMRTWDEASFSFFVYSLAFSSFSLAFDHSYLFFATEICTFAVAFASEKTKFDITQCPSYIGEALREVTVWNNSDRGFWKRSMFHHKLSRYGDSFLGFRVGFGLDLSFSILNIRCML